MKLNLRESLSSSGVAPQCGLSATSQQVEVESLSIQSFGLKTQEHLSSIIPSQERFLFLCTLTHIRLQ